MAHSYQALAGGAARKAFAPLFRARWQNMQNIVSNSAFLSLIPKGYKTYYTAFIQQWLDWAQGFVPQLHRYDFFSTGMGYTVCDIFTKECMSGGYRFVSVNPQLKEFIESWDNDELLTVFNAMFFYSNAGGNAILCLTPVDGELYASVYSIDRVIFQIGRRGEITQAMLLNRFVAGETVYYVREIRVKRKGKNYYKADIAPGTLVTAPTWSAGPLREVPLQVEQQWLNCYGNIKPSTWYELPKRMRSLGLYNVKNKSVAVALKDMPGYSDSTLHTALDVLYSIDYNYTQGQVDQYLGKGRTLVPKQMQKVNVNQPGTLANGMTFNEALQTEGAPLEDTFFTQIPDNNLNGDQVKPTFIQPDLRGEAHKYIRDADLELLASKVGLSSSTLANHLTYNSSKTATEVVSEQDTTEKSVNNKRALANIAINNMLADVAYFYGYTDEVTIEWGRAAANTSRENQELMADYNANTLPLRDYLRKRWPDLSEQEIEDMAERVKTERTEKQSVGGGLFNDKDYFGGTE
ncbi:MAG: portal protein [Caudoviricetes sp.]|nr:MAG: portal protein [Caudoviricetes sp.]